MAALFSKSDMMSARVPLPTMALCGVCGLKDTCNTPKMPVSGDGRRGILIVGEAPGADEDDRGIQFVGKTGQYLMRVLDGCGIDMRRDCWLQNAIRCRPQNNKIADHPKSVEYCRPNVLRDLDDLNPTVVILLGANAVKSVIGHLWRPDTGPMRRWAGWQIPAHRPNAWVCPTYHPSYLMREENPVLDAAFARDIGRAVAKRGRPWTTPPDYPSQVEKIIDTKIAADRVDAYRDGLVAIDFESTTLKPDSSRAELVSCSVCWNGTETIAFPWHGPVRESVYALFRDPNVGKIAANLKHEDRWCRRILGVRPRNWRFDTMLAAHALDSRKGITGLKFQSFVMLGARDYSIQVEQFLKPGGDEKGGNAVNQIREIKLDKLLNYNGLDSLLEYELAMIQSRKLGIDLWA